MSSSFPKVHPGSVGPEDSGCIGRPAHARLRYHQELTSLDEQALYGSPDRRDVHFSARQRKRGPAQASRRKLQPAGGFMSDRVEFDVVCPNNHNQTVGFSPEEFDAALKSDALVFHCNTCDTDWTPSSEVIAKLRKQFPKNSS